MTRKQVRQVQRSFEVIRPIADLAAGVFYSRLFEIDPSLRGLFHADLREQGKKLVQALTVAVRGLERWEQVAPAVEDLGARHVGYGVRDEHYDTVGAALLWTLERALGDGFSSEVREAWAAAYSAVADTMRRGAARPIPQGAKAA